ncbi:esterase-like activity of phytase family protein, partial [Streptomyces sp. NPDC057052]
MSPHATGRRAVRRSVAAVVPLSVLAALTTAGPASAHTRSGEARVISTATLGDIPLGTFSNALLPGSVAEDRGVDLGGIGSDIHPAGRKGEYWTVTDRGPNGQIKVDGTKRRTFPVPGFDPAIVRIKVSGGTVKVLRSIPLTTSSGKPVTGLSNQAERDEAPYSYDARTPLPFDPNGLDTEGVVPA